MERTGDHTHRAVPSLPVSPTNITSSTAQEEDSIKVSEVYGLIMSCLRELKICSAEGYSFDNKVIKEIVTRKTKEKTQKQRTFPLGLDLSEKLSSDALDTSRSRTPTLSPNFLKDGLGYW